MMKAQSEQIEYIFLILRENNIFSLNDILKLKRRKETLLYSKDYPWIGAICGILNDFYSFTERNIENVKGQLFMVDRIDEQDHNNLFKYSCIFPGRMIVSVGRLFYLDDPDTAFLDIEFFYKLFWGRCLFENDLVHISPFYRYTELSPGEANPENCIAEYLTLPKANRKKIAELDQCGTSGFGKAVKADRIYISMPWLYNADIQTYLEIISKHKSEFELYNLNLEKLTQDASDTEKFLRDFEYKFKEANANIAIELEKEKHRLNKQGMTTILGMMITAIPLIFSDSSVLGSAAAQTVLGGMNGYQVLTDIKELGELKNVGRDNPFWVLWKWKNRTDEMK